MDTCFQNRCLMCLSYSGPEKTKHLLENMFCMFSESFLTEQLKTFCRCWGCSGSGKPKHRLENMFPMFSEMTENLENMLFNKCICFSGPQQPKHLSPKQVSRKQVFLVVGGT